MTTLILKPHSTPATLLWLQANYEPVEGVCIPRNSMYNQYVEFCRSHGMLPVNAVRYDITLLVFDFQQAASFGKIIRQKFPGLTTRRLGTRGQSRYHYYGLAVKSGASLFAQSSFTRHAFTNVKPEQISGSLIHKAQNRCYIPHPLFNLPSNDILTGLPSNILRGEAETIHIMYTLHCQQLIDYSIHFQFKEVKQYISHFWEGFPSHLSPLLGNNSIVSLIGVCDVITYRAITHATLPCVMMEEVASSRTEESIRLAESIIDWLVTSLANTPQVLRRMKLHAARSLLHSVRRQASLNHLCCNLRFILSSDSHLKQMLADWECVDVQVIADETNFSVGASKMNYASQIISCCKDLEKLLKTRPELSKLGDWMKELVEHCVTSHVENFKKTGEKLKNFACNFILIWSSIGTRILRELTLLGAHSFGAFHLLYLMLSDYGAQLVESLIVEDRIHRLTANVGIGNPPESDDFEAGTLCDAQCPCKFMYHREEGLSYEADTSDKSQIGVNFTVTTTTPTSSFMHGEALSDSSIEFCPDPADTTTQDAPTYCQVYTDHSTVPDYCHPSEAQPTSGPHPYDLQSPTQQQLLIPRPSCSFQGMMIHDEDAYQNVNGSMEKDNGASLGTTKDGFKLLPPPEESRPTIRLAEDQFCVHTHACNGNDQSCVGTIMSGCPDENSATFYTNSGSGIVGGSVSGLCDSSGQNGNNNGYYTVASISSSSGGQCVDNFYSMETSGFPLTSSHQY